MKIISKQQTKIKQTNMKKTSYIIIAFWAFLLLAYVGVFVFYISADPLPLNRLRDQLTGDNTMVSRELPTFRHLVVTVPAVKKLNEEWEKKNEGRLAIRRSFQGNLFVAPVERAEACADLLLPVAGDTLYRSSSRLVCPRRVMNRLSFSAEGDTLLVALNLDVEEALAYSRAGYLKENGDVGNLLFWTTEPLQSLRVALNDLSVSCYYLEQDSLVVSNSGAFSLVRSTVGAVNLCLSPGETFNVLQGSCVGRLYYDTYGDWRQDSPVHFSDEPGDDSRIDCEIYTGKAHQIYLDSTHARRIFWQPN